MSARTERQSFLERQPSYWLKRSNQALRRRVDNELRPLGITLSQRDALLTLRHEGPASYAELARRLNLEASSVSRLIEGLAKKTLVVVSRDDTDMRARVITITPDGTTLLDDSPGSARIASRLLRRSLSKEEVAELVRMLRICAEVFDDTEPEPPTRPSKRNQSTRRHERKKT